MEKNILILTTISGFLDKFEKENVKLLLEMGYRVHYAANTKEQHYLFDEKKIRDMGVEIHHIDVARSPYMLLDNRKAFFQLLKLVEEYHIEAIHCHTPVGGVLGRLVGRYYKKKRLRVIYTAHGFHFYKGAQLINNSLYYAAEKILAHYTDILVVINKEDYGNAKRFRLKPGGLVFQIPGVGLDLQRFRPFTEEERAKRRKELGLGENDFFLVSVGELNENKNQEIVLKALKKMKDSGKDLSHIKYGICGDGFFRQRIKEKIAEYGLEEIAVMYGYCTKVWEILGCADASAFPSRREGLGMAALESLAMGVPVIAADNRGTREYMIPGKNGYVCSWDDESSFARGIEAIRDMEPGHLTDMKEECRKSAEKFDKKYTNQIMHIVYENLDRKLEYNANYDKKKDQKAKCKNQCYYGSL